VSTDPSHPAPPETLQPCLTKPGLEVIKGLLDELEITHHISEAGRLITRWKGYTIVFTLRDDNELYSVRAFYDGTYSMDHRPLLRDAIDEWHHEYLWPKIFTLGEDDGSVVLVADAHLRLDGGVTREHLRTNTVGWINSMGSFHLWLLQRLRLAVGTD
jgi:hypothetical protein